MRRRHLFPAMLLGASALWSMAAVSFSAPSQSYDYLDALVVDERYAHGTIWEDVDIAHAHKLSDQDELLFIKMLEAFDGPSQGNPSRPLFLDQAKSSLEQKKCQRFAEPCEIKIHLNKTIKPSLIHGDLRLVQLREMSIVQEVSLYENKIEFGAKFEESRNIRFMLTERGWVIKSVEHVANDPFELSPAESLDTGKMIGLNYYPQSAPWDQFWPEFPVADIENDLDMVTGLGANALRIFIQHDYFANLDTQKDGLTKLRRFLDLCEDREIKVIVTLFDLRADYRLQNWSRDSVHMTTILNAIHEHPALLAVDLKNQPDLDFEGAGQNLVTAWLDAMIASAQQNHSDIPLTIGWSDPSKATLLSEKLNLVSFHDYSHPSGLSSRLHAVQQNAGDKPVFVTEIGHSRWSLFGENSDKQAARLSEQLEELANADGVFVWTLHDFDDIGANIVGHRPWRKAQQKAYGILTSEGDRRPAAEALYSFNQTFLSTPKGD